ncbi:MAG: hypothetical protein KDE45_22490, partial [Caldilineaceae bacterium]|nr:hypothetical protein [Caldilineaceae bacterium]
MPTSTTANYADEGNHHVTLFFPRLACQHCALRAPVDALDCRNIFVRSSIGSIHMLHDLPKRVRSRLRLVRAHWKRRRSKARFIVITGSSAKTTTTSLLTNILATTYKVRSQIEANRLENALEVLNRLDGTEDFVVVETGTGQPGDLKVLMELLKPDISIVTMVAVEHYSAFRGIEAVEKEKSEVVRALGRAGIAVLNADDARVNAMAEQTSARVVTFGGNGSDY